MKILHIIPTYLPANLASGPIQAIHSLNKELVRMGVEVTVYTGNCEGDKILDVPVLEEVMVDGVKVFYFPINFKPWQYSNELRKALKKNVKNFDLVHISSIFLSYLTLGAYYARKYARPYIISSHGMLMKRPLQSKWLKKKLYLSVIEKKNLKYVQAIHFTTESEKNEYFEMRLPKTKAIVIPHGITFEAPIINLQKGFFRKKFNISENKKIILTMGRINWIKGFDTLLPAIALALKEEKEAMLVIAGPDGGYKKEVEKLTLALQLENNILFTGELKGEDKIAVFSESDVFILASYSENFSVVAGEAMSFGLPVVMTKGVGIAPLVEKYNAGIVVEKKVKDVSSAILRVFQDLNLAKMFGDNGRKLVKEEFSPEKVALTMKRAYEDAIKDYKFSNTNSGNLG